MLLGFITGILNKYIGTYFEDIDASQLTGNIFGGGVSLHNLKLRPTVFESLGIPFHVIAGKCGTLEVKYSITKLYSEPVIVNLRDLYVLIVPSQSIQYDAEMEEDEHQSEKMRQLEVFESVKHHLSHPQEHRSSLLDPKNVSQEITYFDMWVMQVLRNLKFIIEFVHIRFEDDITKKREPFAGGIFLQNLTLLTTDSSWQSQFVKDYAPETIFKLVKIVGLSVYWNSFPIHLVKKDKDLKSMFARLSNPLKDPNDTATFKFILEPMSTDLRIQLTPFPDGIKLPFSKPRILVEVELDDLVLHTSDKQIHDIIPFLDTFEDLTRSYKYRKHRPIFNDPIYKGHYKEWWIFAYESVLDDITRRRNNFRWKVISDHRKKCKTYLKTYFKKKVEGKTSHEIEETIKQMELELDLFNLIMLRKQVDLIAAHQGRGSQGQEGTSAAPPLPVVGYYAWFMSWFFWPSPAGVEAQTQTEPPRPGNPVLRSSIGGKFAASELTPLDKEDLRIAVGFAKNMDIVNYPNNYTDMEISVLMNQLRLIIQHVSSKHRETILDGVLDRVCFAFRSRPFGTGLQVELKMGRIEVYGGDFPQGNIDDMFAVPQIITTANADTTEYFFKFLYEKSPLDGDVDHKVSLEGLALQLTYQAEAIERIVECFTSRKPASYAVGPIPVAKVMKKVIMFKNAPTARLLRLMENRGKVAVSICLIAPYIIVPQEISGKRDFFVVQLGEVNIVGTVIGGILCERGGCAHLL